MVCVVRGRLPGRGAEAGVTRHTVVPASVGVWVVVERVNGDLVHVAEFPKRSDARRMAARLNGTNSRGRVS